LREGCGGCGERSEPQHCPEERSDEGIAEAEAKPEAARPERATADEMVNDIICRFKNLLEQKETDGIILLWQARGTPKK
jgi:hypothetical protein